MMATPLLVQPHIEKLLGKIISKENIKDATISVQSGSEFGEGYIAVNSAVNIIGEGKVLNLFIKSAPTTDKLRKKSYLRKAFANEAHFYSNVYPAFSKFQNERDIKYPFNSIARFYAATTIDLEESIIMENLKEQGYSTFDGRHQMNDEHVGYVLAKFAQFHAVSFAMKDQESDLFESLSSNLCDVMWECRDEFNLEKIYRTNWEGVKKSFDCSKYGTLLNKYENLIDILMDVPCNARKYVDKYCIITQGDCWCNNIMFKYKNPSDVTRPCDIKLIDWQMLRVNTPILDLSYFFYTVASKRMMANLDTYLKIYYNTFSETLKQLGSDPEKLYPYKIFLDHWQRFCKNGLLMSLMIIKAMLAENYELPDQNKFYDDFSIGFTSTIKNEDLYNQRIRDIFEHLIENNYL